jgi:glucose/arabinose dehydrogenase
MRRCLLIQLILLVLLAVPGSARAATLDPIGTFNSPVFVTSEPGDPDRLLVVEQGGTIELSDHGVVKPFLDLARANLVSSGGERGLLSVALAPDYSTSHRLYVDYTGPDGDLKVDEFTASGDTVDLSTRRPLLSIDHSAYANHNGGQLQFGPDGYLYISTGDGGSGGDPFESGQTTGALLGKLLRIDPTAAGASPYSIPPGNPFADGRAGAPEVWSYGLRNPWRFSFDRSTGALLIGDVGQGVREEIDYSPQPVGGGGLNFGWNCREGLIAYSSPGARCTGASGFTDPIFDYPHNGGNCAITGGYVVRDASLGDLYGRYLFADECVGQIRSLVPGLPASGERSEGLTVSGPSSFGQDSCGRIYVASLGTGKVSRFVGAAPTDCTTQPPPGEPPPPTTTPPEPPSCAGEPATRVADAGAKIMGSPGDDVIVADGRDNRIKAGAGDDLICGLAGDDILKGGPGRDVLLGGHGNDKCDAGRKDHTSSC